MTKLFPPGFVALLAALFAVGCSSPTTTTINLPPADVNGQNFLTLTTVRYQFAPSYFRATAAFRSGLTEGFGKDIYITCNGWVVVDTRHRPSQGDSSQLIFDAGRGDTLFLWHYEGRDTSFTIAVKRAVPITITSPTTGQTLRRSSPFGVTFTPVSPINLRRVKLSDFFGDTLIAKTQFNRGDGEVGLVTPDSTVLRQGNGRVEIYDALDTEFSIHTIHSVSVKHEDYSGSQFVLWQ